MKPAQLALLRDSRLSDAARILGFHLSGLEGEQEVSHDSLAALLYGTPNTDTVGRHLRQLIVHGYVEKVKEGGRGHSPVYRWVGIPRENTRPIEIARENSSPIETKPANNHGLSADLGGGYMGGESPPPPPSPPVRAREDVENSGEVPQQAPRPARFDELRDWLGLDADAADAFAPTASSATWAAAILGKYGPNGTQEHSWNGTPTERRPKVIAEALRDYTANGARPFKANLFDGYVRQARDGPPRIAPGSEAARVLSHSRDPTPGATRNGRGSLQPIAVPAGILANLERSALEKLGSEAPPDELDQEVHRRAAEWTKHHGQPAVHR
jgi:hypothetical protein